MGRGRWRPGTNTHRSSLPRPGSTMTHRSSRSANLELQIVVSMLVLKPGELGWKASQLLTKKFLAKQARSQSFNVYGRNYYSANFLRSRVRQRNVVFWLAFGWIFFVTGSIGDRQSKPLNQLSTRTRLDFVVNYSRRVEVAARRILIYTSRGVLVAAEVR